MDRFRDLLVSWGPVSAAGARGRQYGANESCPERDVTLAHLCLLLYRVCTLAAT